MIQCNEAHFRPHFKDSNVCQTETPRHDAACAGEEVHYKSNGELSLWLECRADVLSTMVAVLVVVVVVVVNISMKKGFQSLLGCFQIGLVPFLCRMGQPNPWQFSTGGQFAWISTRAMVQQDVPRRGNDGVTITQLCRCAEPAGAKLILKLQVVGGICEP